VLRRYNLSPKESDLLVQLDCNLLSHDLKSMPALARRVEALGYGCIWTAETQHDPFLPVALAASATSSVKLGTAIALAFPRSPMVLAYTAWDLQKASNGRFILGLGSQVKAHNERRFSVKFESPAPKLREVVRALRAIWDCWQKGTPLNFEGRFYRFNLMTPFFNPGPIEYPNIPVYIAGVNRHMCRVAGEVADGLHVHPLHTVRYLRECVHPAVEEGLRLSGRSRQDFTYVSSTFVIVGESEAERSRDERFVRQQIAFYASTRTYAPVLAVHGWEELTSRLYHKSIEGNWQGMAELITDEMLDAFAVSGTYQEIGSKLCERYQGLLDRTSLYHHPDSAAFDDPRLHRLIKEVNGPTTT
jgi:probable F420-dependent oxidoreductase